jgi:hypothetical protein
VEDWTEVRRVRAGPIFGFEFCLRMSKEIGRAWIQERIVILRKQKVMLSVDLAEMYGVDHKRMIEAVRRNFDRFPLDFMFQLSDREFTDLRTQIASAKWRKNRVPPYAFTEQGIAMLSSVLHSPAAILVNIQIMREFVAIRKFLMTHQELAERIDQLEARYDNQFRSIFEAIRALISPTISSQKTIGIHSENDDQT